MRVQSNPPDFRVLRIDGIYRNKAPKHGRDGYAERKGLGVFEF